MRVLVSAYACEPGKGSEPGVGWNLVRHLAERHEVWVLTRANNRSAIEAGLARRPMPSLHFVYHDLPPWARFWKKGQRGVQVYYYLWQLTAIPVVRRLHREVGFDVAHHMTFARYWSPSVLAFLKGVPFVWGPVGGGESAPLVFWCSLGPRGLAYEAARTGARFLAERDPLVRLTVRRASIALATTAETASRLKRLGARQVNMLLPVALADEEIEGLGQLPSPGNTPVRFMSVGRLLALKGFHLAVQAFAKSGLRDAEYYIVGKGPERRRLEALARRLGVAERVCFLGQLPRRRVLELLAQVHALVHPSLHDAAGAMVCLEAMAAGRPVICLDLGGLSVQVTDATGFKIPARTAAQVVRDFAEAMRGVANDPRMARSLGEAGKERAREMFSWKLRTEQMSRIYQQIIRGI